MRPLRLILEGFGCYRQAVEADFSGVDFFALVGPTGSGKSTLIDGLCFALYGTVPRWGKENVIAQALAPAANACRVTLVFEAAGKRYGAVRALTRDRKGVVHTKEARLELLDPEIPADAPIGDILATSVDQIAEGPDWVKSCVQDILGLTYEHFTQSVLLPQGRFSEFLQAKATDRQDLLVELLAFGVYNTVGQRAREQAKLAAERIRNARSAREDLAGVTEEAETRAATRVRELTDLASALEDKLNTVSQLRDQADRAAQQAREARDESAILAAVLTPPEVSGLARRIVDADRLLAERKQQRDEADKNETQAERDRAALPDKTVMEVLRAAYAENRELTSQLRRREQDLAEKRAGQELKAEEFQSAEKQVRLAREALAQAERTHAAVALAEDLRIGQTCPVCLQRVASLPHHTVPADLSNARIEVTQAEHQLSLIQAAHQKTIRAAATASSAVEGTQEQLEKVSARLAQAPGEPEVAKSLEEIAAADEALSKARENARARRAALAAAEQSRASLGEEETQAWAAFGRSRDSVVALRAPAIEDGNLASAWAKLTTWATAQYADRKTRQPGLDAAAAALQQRVITEEGAFTGLLAEHNISDVTDPARASAAVATHRERAENQLAVIREDRRRAARLDEQIRALRDEEQVAALLGNLLKATSFERWLCGEALDSLVAEASETLMELSAGQYQLDRDNRNDLIVIDYQDAGAQRPVNTLSGGETFQASLALALALSRQVIGLSAGMRDLNSMFLDEGFGTLDEDTLETVATTLERLAANSDRMVGVITHVPALAERVPVRFVVSRTGATSTLRKERV
jgi:DNA repair protein SbcC/Rad50